MVCRKLLCVIVMFPSLVHFGQNYFGYKGLASILVPHIILRLMVRPRSSIVLWKCICNALQAQDQRNGHGGYHGHSFVIILVYTQQLRKLHLR